MTNTLDTTAPRPLALVAGGSRGLGLLIARRLGEQGYRLVISARDLDELQEARDQLSADGHLVEVRACDVADAAAVTALVTEVEAEIGAIEVLMTVAGVIQVGPLNALERHHFIKAINIMLWGPIHTAMAVVGPMQQRGRGKIGIITSVGGLVSVPHLLPYSTAKFGAVGFANGLRAALAGSGVTVTTVAPGLMRTGSHFQAEFVGQHDREFAWFSTAASLPVMSMDAERAAATIVHGVLAGRSMLLVGWLPKIAMRVNGLAPQTMAWAMGIGARLLPSAPAGRAGGAGTGGTSNATVRGWEAKDTLKPATATVVRSLTTLGRRAAARFNQRP